MSASPAPTAPSENTQELFDEALATGVHSLNADSIGHITGEFADDTASIIPRNPGTDAPSDAEPAPDGTNASGGGAGEAQAEIPAQVPPEAERAAAGDAGNEDGGEAPQPPAGDDGGGEEPGGGPPAGADADEGAAAAVNPEDDDEDESIFISSQMDEIVLHSRSTRLFTTR